MDKQEGVLSNEKVYYQTRRCIIKREGLSSNKNMFIKREHVSLYTHWTNICEITIYVHTKSNEIETVNMWREW